MRKTESELYYGKLIGGVGDVLSYLGDRASEFRWTAVRSLDSDCAPSHILDVLRRLGIEARLEADSVFLSGEHLHVAAQKGLFCGFDEVWLWREEPRNRHFTSDVVLTSDGINLNDGLPTNVENAMRQLGCVLALGDGCGLNYVTTDYALADEIEQPVGDSGERTQGIESSLTHPSTESS